MNTDKQDQQGDGPRDAYCITRYYHDKFDRATGIGLNVNNENSGINTFQSSCTQYFLRIL